MSTLLVQWLIVAACGLVAFVYVARRYWPARSRSGSACASDDGGAGGCGSCGGCAGPAEAPADRSAKSVSSEQPILFHR